MSNVPERFVGDIIKNAIRDAIKNGLKTDLLWAINERPSVETFGTTLQYMDDNHLKGKRQLNELIKVIMRCLPK